jgi:DNA-binding NtrC family response regulator
MVMYLRPIALGRPRIVVVDGDAPTLSRICGILQSKGYQAIGVEAVPAACRFVQRQRVDLVLTTMSLSEEDRRAWTSALSHLDVRVPVVAMCEASSVHALDLFDTANEFSAAAVLRRPFTAQTLLQVLGALLPAPAQPLRSASSSVRPDWPGLIEGSTAIH